MSIQPGGTYGVELPAGTYVVDINRLSIDRATSLSQTVQIVSQQVTRLNLDLDVPQFVRNSKKCITIYYSLYG